MTVTAADPTLRDIVAPVVAELVARAPQAAGHLMLVGAVCRDVLHREAGHIFTLRRTGDLDLALAVDDRALYDDAVRGLPRLRTAAQVRFELAGVKVDLVPFGGVEAPDGAVPLEDGVEPLDVLGFGDVWAAARVVRLGQGLEVRVPTIPGYTVLKLAAWAARSRVGEFKDAGDLACAMFWYQTASAVTDRLYDEARGRQLLEHAWSQDDGASLDPHTLMLTDDSMTLLAPSRRAELVARWAGVDQNLLATYLENANLPGWPQRGNPALVEHVRSLYVGMTLPGTPPPSQRGSQDGP